MSDQEVMGHHPAMPIEERVCAKCKHLDDDQCRKLTFEINDWEPTEVVIREVDRAAWDSSVTIANPDTFGCNQWEAKGE